MSRDSERHDDAGSGLQVRQSWDGSRVQLRSSYKQAVATQPSGYSGKHNSTDARFDMDGKVSDYVVSDQQGNVTSRNGRKVSYFFTNIPECLPTFRLRQQFEVCGILTDITIARKRNARGQIYGFVRFSNVKNASKLSNTLNNVWFGYLRVWAREARFDRFAVNDNKPLTVSKNVKRKNDGEGGKKEVERVKGEGEKIVRKGEGEEKMGGGRRGEGEKMLRIGQVEVKVSEEDEVRKKGVHVLSPVLKGRKGRPKVTPREKVVVLNIDEDGLVSRSVEKEREGDKPAPRVQLVQVGEGKNIVYHSRQEDMHWAGSGVVATVGVAFQIIFVSSKLDLVILCLDYLARHE